MFDAKAVSRAIRLKKKGSLRPDLDSAGQEAVDPVDAYEAMKKVEMDNAMSEPEHIPPSDAAMGEDESSQDEAKRKMISARIARYFDSMSV